MAIRQIRCGKAAGPENIPAEEFQVRSGIMTASLAAVSASKDLNIHKEESNIVKCNREDNHSIILREKSV
ncbi:unnamed protein product [Schistosoma margrebowiei]|uniref:Uncharacterized protein n=1 Tax=Schistosoma margrebowiei TaxID=48269 RepID=A0A183N078_9TREM|nr:unnamed protein product [Schistosoma margrebowiei]